MIRRKSLDNLESKICLAFFCIGFAFTSSCSNSESPEDEPPAQRPLSFQTPSFARTWHSKLVLDPKVEAKILLATRGVNSELGYFTFDCKLCPGEALVANDSEIEWKPHLYDGAVPAEATVTVTLNDPWGIVSRKDMDFIIENTPYVQGDEWSRSKVYPGLENRVILETSKNVVSQSGYRWIDGLQPATVVYLGNFGGRYLLLTAAHAYANHPMIYDVVDGICDQNRGYRVPGVEELLLCKELLFRGTNTDFVIVEVEPFAGREEFFDYFDTLNPKFASYEGVELESPLAVAGLGVFGNPYSELTYTTDEDCVAYSKEPKGFPGVEHLWEVEEIDLNNPKHYLQSFMLPCDVSNGDSGAPVFSPITGEIYGIVTGSVWYEDRKMMSSDEIWNTVGLPEEEKHKRGSALFVSLDMIAEDILSQDGLTAEQLAIVEELIRRGNLTVE